MFEIGGERQIHAVFAGPSHSPRPLVVLEAGAFGFSADWAAVQRRLADLGIRSMAYDRAGLGFSPPGPEPRDGLAIVADLERFLLQAGEFGRLVMCGHSMAGLRVRLFTARNSDRVSGVVLVDATTPEAMDSKVVSGFVGPFSVASRLAAWGAGAGLLAPLAGTGLADAIGLDGPAGIEKRWAFADPGHNHWAAREVELWSQSARQARDAGVFDPQLPVAVILAGGLADRGGFGVGQAAPARASHHGFIETVAGASHATMLNHEFAGAIVRGIEHVMTVSVA